MWKRDGTGCSNGILLLGWSSGRRGSDRGAPAFAPACQALRELRLAGHGEGAGRSPPKFLPHLKNEGGQGAPLSLAILRVFEAPRRVVRALCPFLALLPFPGPSST